MKSIGKINQMKTERKGKQSYIERINANAPSGWSVRTTFAVDSDAVDSLKIYRVKTV